MEEQLTKWWEDYIAARDADLTRLERTQGIREAAEKLTRATDQILDCGQEVPENVLSKREIIAIAFAACVKIVRDLLTQLEKDALAARNGEKL